MRAYLRDGERRADALGNRGPIRFTADGELHPDILEAYWRCGFYVFEGVLKADELADIEARHARHPGPPADRAGRASRRARAARRWAPTARRRPCSGPSRSATRSAAPALANGRHPVKMFEPKRGGRRAEGGRLPDPGLAAILRGRAAGLWPSRAARRRRGDQRRRLRAVQRGAVHQGAGPRRLGRLAPGRRDALGQPGLGRGHPRLQLHGPALWLHAGQRRLGRARVRTSSAGPTSRRWSRRRAPSGCPRRCRSSAARATSPSPTARRCTAPSPTPAPTGG